MFSDLKGELEEDAVSISADQDPETDYNLAVGFWEMGLLDEGEHQVSRWRIGQKDFVLGYRPTPAGTMFPGEGSPGGAFAGTSRFSRPNIDADTRTAAATAYESAQNWGDALSHFLQFYGNNIDYRHVGERIKALRS
jgi:hypothetical protein